MSNVLYWIAIVLVVFWAIGFLGYSAGRMIHILLILAIMSVLLRIISGRRF